MEKIVHEALKSNPNGYVTTKGVYICVLQCVHVRVSHNNTISMMHSKCATSLHRQCATKFTEKPHQHIHTILIWLLYHYNAP